MVGRRGVALDTALQCELLSTAQQKLSPPASQHLPFPAQVPGLHFDANLSSSLEERSKSFRDFELRRALGLVDGTSKEAVAVHAGVQTSRQGCLERSPEDASLRRTAMALGACVPAQATTAEAAARPPLGSGYRYPRSFLPLSTLTKCLGLEAGPDVTSPIRSSKDLSSDKGSSARRERILALEQGMERHEVEQLRRIAAGTYPLMDDTGETMLPLAPPEEPEFSARLRSRIRTHRKRTLVGEAGGFNALEAVDISMASEGPGGRDEPPSIDPLDREFVKERLTALAVADNDNLLLETEKLAACGAKEEQWLRMATQWSSRAYEVVPAIVLRVVLALGSVARGQDIRSKSGKQELLRVADLLLSSLSSSLQSFDLRLLTVVIVTLTTARVGSQVFLDAVMARLLACHHCDCEALTPSLALQLATAIGKMAESTCLRPKGVGGPSSSTNQKILHEIQNRIVSRIEDCPQDELGRLDGYYLTRLCDQHAQHVIISRMAEVQVGLRDATKHLLPRMIELRKTIERELGPSVRFRLPRPTQKYLAQLEQLDRGAEKVTDIRDRFHDKMNRETSRTQGGACEFRRPGS